MSAALPRLRHSLDIMPSPIPDRPGLLVRDPFRYADSLLVIPPPLVPCLLFFNGENTEADLREALVRLSGELEVGDLLQHLVRTLGEGGFLQNDTLERLREVRHRQFAEASHRLAAHMGAAYPEEPGALATVLEGYMDGPLSGVAPSPDRLCAIAAPHVSLEGGWRCYRAAYRSLGPEHRERVFVLLGTSHYGEPDRFGLTRKPFVTPLGQVAVHQPTVDFLVRQGGAGVSLEDYCHAVEHSIELQIVFLQHLYGPGIRIVPILCGPFARATSSGCPDDDEGVKRFIGALGELAAKEEKSFCYVLGVDMTHRGRRYGDELGARAHSGPMTSVAERDRGRIARVEAGDAPGFWELVRENGDDLRWCGAAPLYTFLRAVPGLKGELLLYDQWNIDDESVVSFAGMRFTYPGSAPLA